jgi:hypothetical protein
VLLIRDHDCLTAKADAIRELVTNWIGHKG